MFCSIVTNRLQSGALCSPSCTTCFPCEKPPPARRIGYEQDRDLHRMLLYAWLDQDEAANRRMWEQIQESPLFAFLEGFVARRQAEGAFRSGDPTLLSRALLALPVHHAVHTKLYGIDTDARDEEVVDLYARFLLDGLRGNGSDTP